MVDPSHANRTRHRPFYHSCRTTCGGSGVDGNGGGADRNHPSTRAVSYTHLDVYKRQSLKGVGCDCLGLARGVWREVVGPEPFPIPPYSRDWGESGPREVLAEGARRMMPEIAPAEVPPGALIPVSYTHLICIRDRLYRFESASKPVR